MNWKNKEVLFNLIKKHKKSGVIILSGDVHFAQFYSTKCKSLTSYNIIEMTTSGLTHHVNSFFKIGEPLLNSNTHPFWIESDIYIDYNYGMLKAKKVNNDDI